MKTNWTRAQQAETDDRLSELEIFCVSGDSEIGGLFVHYAVLWHLVGVEDVGTYHSLDEPGELGGDGGSL